MLLAVLLILILILVSTIAGFTALGLEFVKVGLVSVRVVVCADDTGVSWDDLTILNNDLRGKTVSD